MFGEFNPMAKLTDHEVDLLIKLRQQGMSYGKLAIKFEMSKAGVFYICTGQLRRRY